MDRAKRARLAKAGWRVGSAEDFLDLSPPERAFLDVKRRLARELRNRRVQKKWTQAHVAKRLGSSQARIARMEAADPSVTLDLMVRALLSLGASRKQLARAIEKSAAKRAA
jgi:DNA-binding XRE family transcriptional regulator